MSDGVTVLPAKRIERSILPIQGQKVLLDADLADLYCVETRVVVQEAKRHAGRFPGDFMFRLEAEVLREVVDRNTLTIRVPEDLKERIEKVATLQGISINQSALYAFTKEIADLEASSHFRTVLNGVDKKTMLKEMDRILASVPDRQSPDWDALEDAGE